MILSHVKIDAEGRFHVEGLVPGQSYTGSAPELNSTAAGAIQSNSRGASGVTPGRVGCNADLLTCGRPQSIRPQRPSTGRR